MSASDTVRGRLWMWGHEAGSHDNGWKLPKPSRMTPAEGALYLGVPNLMMVTYGGRPEMPFDQYAIPFRALEKVVWSITGASGQTSPEEREHVIELTQRFPNFTGLLMDDLFATDGTAAISVGELNAVKEKLDLQERRLDLYAICYDKWFGWNVDDHFSLCDYVIFWTWRSETLERLDENFRRFEEITPRNDRLLGCYLYDYGNCTPMSLDRMKMQCEPGLQLLMEGRIVGIVFLASCVCDIELEAVEWTREWISEIALEKLSA